MKINVPQNDKPKVTEGDILVTDTGVPCMVVKGETGKFRVINLRSGVIYRYFDHACDIPDWIHDYKYTHYPQGQYDFSIEVTKK